MSGTAKILISSDSSLCVEFGSEISEQINNKVHALASLVEQANISGVYELLPTYRSLTVYYQPHIVSYAQLSEHLGQLLGNLGEYVPPPPKLVRVPLLYGGEEYGPDLAYIAEQKGLSEQEVIDIHSAPEYRIYMLGFTPGFCYMGGTDPRISVPRLMPPRVKITAGSVGVAGLQAGIYPIDSPGGWRVVGRTPLKLFDPTREQPILFDSGDIIKFYPINEEAFHRISAGEVSVDD